MILLAFEAEDNPISIKYYARSFICIIPVQMLPEILLQKISVQRSHILVDAVQAQILPVFQGLQLPPVRYTHPHPQAVLHWRAQSLSSNLIVWKGICEQQFLHLCRLHREARKMLDV